MKTIFKKLYRNLHWIIVIFLFLYTLIPILSPVLFHFGYYRSAWWIQTIYRFLCHQRPERSLFLFGEKISYSLNELEKLGYNTKVTGYPFVGNEYIGYKIAFCTRDTFIYGLMTITGFITNLSKKKISVKYWVVILLVLPMILDGTIQFISEFLYLGQDTFNLTVQHPFYLSNNLNRAITGGLFGTGIGLVIFPELKTATREDY
ncbi:DUF2085 domain-containing protein [Candidatus Dojkabacteria bacterium]|nr:DUF2085 domain-containing protein [Candidatus Dojkabacteria bacterium]